MGSYQKYIADHSYILPRHAYLFERQNLEDKLKQPYDSLNCWLRSVSEARDILTSQLEHQCETAETIFRSFGLPFLRI
jgi:hypothetical protein